MKIVPVFDMDGTFLDSFPLIYDVALEVFDAFNINPATPYDVKRYYQSTDFLKYYHDLGFAREDCQDAINLFIELYSKKEVPDLVPNAKTVLANLAQTHMLQLVTHETHNNTDKRIQSYGLDSIFDTSHALESRGSFVCKSEYILKFARENPNSIILYVGDIVSDGEAVEKARLKGANAIFLGVTHSYAFNLASHLKQFAKGNPEFATTAKSLEEVAEFITRNSK